MVEIPLRLAWLAAIVLGIAAFVLPRAHAEDTNRAALAAALKSAPVTLDQGILASEKAGKPISAKFEVEDGKLHISVYTVGGGGYTEVIVAPDTGAVASAEKITDSSDLKDAARQKAAMDKATTSLAAATAHAVAQNTGARAVSVYPALADGQPTAVVTLLRDGRFTTVSEKLN